MPADNDIPNGTEVPALAERLAALDDPALRRERGFGRGRSPGEALWSCLVAITGYPYRGTGLDAGIARRLGVSHQYWSGMKRDGKVHGTLPHIHAMGLILLSLKPDDHVVCDPSWMERSTLPEPAVRRPYSRVGRGT